jgi:fumarate hydratase subunit beta
MKTVNMPISEEEIRELKVGDTVNLSGIMLTGRDAVHKWLIDYFIEKTKTPSKEDVAVYEKLIPLLKDSIIYHCGPIVSGFDTGDYKFVAAGPTTSIREEPYQGRVIEHFDLKGVIGKGGMGPLTLQACQDAPAVYFHAIGGSASLIAQSVTKVLDVHKLDLGVPEAIWVIQVDNFPVVVTMDSHGNSIHTEIDKHSKRVLDKLLSN